MKRQKKEMRDFVLAQNQKLLSVDLLHTRIFGNKIYVDVEIECKRFIYHCEHAHKIAEEVHEGIEKTFSKGKACDGACQSCGCGRIIID